MALKKTLNGFFQPKKHAAKSAMKTKHTNILPKNQSENWQCYCTYLKCKMVYEDIVFN